MSTQLKGFKSVTTLVIEFKIIESVDERKHSTFSLTSKAEVVIIESNVDNVFESIYSTINQTFKNCLEKVQVGLFI